MNDRRDYMREYRIKNKDRMKQLRDKYYEDNKDKLKESFRQYYLNNREKRREVGKLHYEQNKSLYLVYSKTRKATIKRACPNSLSEKDFEQIKQIYLQCSKITKETGVIHHVDHIVPLNGKNVCGLHVPWNLQIITAEENLKKGNKHE